MGMDSYKIGLGNLDTKTRRNAESDNVSFWNEEAKKLSWFKPWTETLVWNSPFAKWFIGGEINASYNTLDVHQDNIAKKPAILWEGEDGTSRTITYADLYTDVCKFANVLKSLGIKKGDRVTIYLPMVPELPITMLACARIGAIHTVVFSGFSAASLRDRIDDSKSKVIVTADVGYRRGSSIDLKGIIDESISGLNFVEHVVVLKRAEGNLQLGPKDSFWHELMNGSSDKCEPEHLESTHPLFILYTSGTTGKPKGVLHGTGGYLTHLNSTFQWAFDIKDSDIFFCTADIGWVTGHSYVVYGPLLHGATEVMYEGVPDYPNTSRIWDIIDKYGVTIFYTTPTALRMFMKFGDTIPNSFKLSSLRLLGTVGEPINPEAWMWYYKTVGNSKCPIVDTWWQTETGGILISPQVGAIDLKPGSATKPFYGIKPVIVDKNGKVLKGECEGNLCIAQSWPGQMRTVYGDHQRFIDTYFSQFDGKYFTGDGCRRDKDGYYWITGRVDDVIIVSGHNLGTAEIESAFVAHPRVAEAAVVGFPHDIKGNGLYCYVTLNVGEKEDGDLDRELKIHVKKTIGSHAFPDFIHFTPGLPKTRSGKIMRRILRKIAANEHDQLGDTTTLADPSVVESLVDNRKNR